MRQARGFKDGKIYSGERIVCKQNDRKLGVFNGMFFTVISQDGQYYHLKTDDHKDYSLQITPEGFNQYERLPYNKSKQYIGRKLIADFGYVSTCHSFQGSEADKVAYIDEHCDAWDIWRHRYTGITRAIEEIRVYKDKE